jgi:hypothetical protein
MHRHILRFPKDYLLVEVFQPRLAACLHNTNDQLICLGDSSCIPLDLQFFDMRRKKNGRCISTSINEGILNRGLNLGGRLVNSYKYSQV